MLRRLTTRKRVIDERMGHVGGGNCPHPQDPNDCHPRMVNSDSVEFNVQLDRECRFADKMTCAKNH